MAVLDLGATATSIVEVERQLAQLRRRAAARAQEGATPPARATVLTVVVYATRRAHAERAARTVALLSDRHPSRAVILFHDERGREGFHADLSLHCHLAETPLRQVSYEQIVVRARAEVPQLLPSVAIPLLVSDLPVFLWWTGTPGFEAPYFRDLLSLADRLIVDSADFVHPDAALPELWRLSRDGTFGVTDLNWTRLTPWRELVAQFFDVREWRPYLDAVTGARVSFAVDMDGREIHPSQALLLLGWLAALLGWQPVEHIAPSEAGGLLFRMRRADGHPVWVRVRPRFVKGIDEGHVTGFRLQCGNDRPLAEFVIKRAEDGTPHAETEALLDGTSVMRSTVYLPMASVIDLLGEEFTITRSDVVYEAALEALCKLTLVGG